MGSTIDGHAGWWREELAPLRHKRRQCARVRSSTHYLRLGSACDDIQGLAGLPTIYLYTTNLKRRDKYKISADSKYTVLQPMVNTCSKQIINNTAQSQALKMHWNTCRKLIIYNVEIHKKHCVCEMDLYINSELLLIYGAIPGAFTRQVTVEIEPIYDDHHVFEVASTRQW